MGKKEWDEHIKELKEQEENFNKELKEYNKNNPKRNIIHIGKGKKFDF